MYNGHWPSHCGEGGYEHSCPQLIPCPINKRGKQHEPQHGATLPPTETVLIAAQHQITATQVADENRIGFWPQLFGSIPQWITLEPRIFARMDRFCVDYIGGIWNFYTLSNGGAFMTPQADSEEP